VIIIFTLVCAGALIVFCVELVALNMDSDKGGAQKQQSPESPPTGDLDEKEDQQAPDSESTGDTELPDDTAPPASGSQSGEQSQPPVVKQHELPMHDDAHRLILSASEGLFDHFEVEDGWEFIYKADAEVKLQIVSDLITPPGGLSALVETLLRPYLNGGDSMVAGERQIANSSVRGIYVYGDNNGESYEAWVFELVVEDNNGKAVDFIINYRNEEQKEALYTILDTLEMIDDTDTPEEPED